MDTLLEKLKDANVPRYLSNDYDERSIYIAVPDRYNFDPIPEFELDPLLIERKYQKGTFEEILRDFKYIIDDERRISVIEHQETNFNLPDSVYEDLDNSFDINNERFQKYMSDIKYDNFGYGSLLDYIPILWDTDGNAVLVNCNPDSKHYKKISLNAVDGHGREGFYISKRPFNEILDRIVELEKKNDDDYFSIQELMYEDENMMIDFG